MCPLRSATHSSMDTLPANWFWQPSCSHSTTPTCGKNTTQFVLWTPQWTHYLLTGSDSLLADMAQHQHVMITLRSRQLLKMGTWLPETCWATCKGEIKDNTKVTSSWFLIHTELGCTVNHTSDSRLCLMYTAIPHQSWISSIQFLICMQICHLRYKVLMLNF